MGKNSDTPEQVTETQISDVSPTLKPFITDALTRGQGEIDRLLGFPGGFNPLQREAQQQQLDFISRDLPRGIQREQRTRRRLRPDLEYLKGLIQPFDPQSEITQGLINASINPVRREFLETTLPRLGATEQQIAGGPGGSRGALIASDLGRNYLSDIGDLSSRILAQQQQQQTGFGLSATGQRQNILGKIFPESYQRQLGLQQLGPELMAEIGEQRQTNILDLLKKYSDLFSPATGGQTTTTGTTSGGPRTSGLVSGLGGAITGGTLGGGLASILGPSLSLGPVGGAALGSFGASALPFFGPVGAGLGLLLGSGIL